MASVPMVMQQIRRARRECAKPPSVGQFRAYEAAYRRIFEALDEHAGEECLDEVAEWALEWTRRQQRLPSPSRLRAEAREACERREVDVPPASPLLE